MADLYASNRNKVASAGRAGEVVANPFVWDVEAAANGDKVFIGELPAFHRLLPEACNVIVDGDTTALNYDLVLEDDAGDVTLVNDQAVVAATFTRTAFSTFQACYEAGVKPTNRRIYVLLNTAPTAAGGKVVANIASYPVS